MPTSTLGPPVLCKGRVAQLPQPMGSAFPYKPGGVLQAFPEVVGRGTGGMGTAGGVCDLQDTGLYMGLFGGWGAVRVSQ